MSAVALALLAYLLGSIPFAVIVSRAFTLPDPRSYGSGNPGATNVLRTGRKSAAALTLLGDAFKGWLAVFLAQRLAEAGSSDVAVAAGLIDLGDRLWDLDDIESMVIVASDLMSRTLDAVRAGFGMVDPAEETIVIRNEWRAPGVASVAGVHRFRDYGTLNSP